MRMRFLLAAFMLLMVGSSAAAQSNDVPGNYPLITADNAHQLAIIARVRPNHLLSDSSRPIAAAQVAFHPDSQLLAIAVTGNLESTIGLVNAHTGAVIAILEDERRFRHYIFALTFSQDGALLATLRGDAFTVWDVENAKPLFADNSSFSLHLPYIATFSPDNRRLYLYDDRVSLDTNIAILHIWDIEQQREVDRMEFCSRFFALQGNYAVCRANNDSALAFTDLTTLDVISVDIPYSGYSDRYGLTPDGRIFSFYDYDLSSGEYDYFLVDMENQTLMQQYETVYQTNVTPRVPFQYQADPSAHLVLFGDPDIGLLDALTGEAFFTFVGHSRDQAQFSPDGTLIAFTDYNYQDGKGLVDIYAVTECYVTANRVINLRTGPGTEYDSPDVMESTERFAVSGQMQQGIYTWYQLSIGLWIRGDVIETHGTC